ncbi:hypothetical protein P8452_42195 [Trifolium repens]|nr:hypothetical protein P8452_42195 [Trifolium repens]
MPLYAEFEGLVTFTFTDSFISPSLLINSAARTNDEAKNMTATKECTSDPFLFFIYSVIFIFEFQIYSIYIPSIYVASIFLTFYYYYLLHFQSEIAAYESEKKATT